MSGKGFSDHGLRVARWVVQGGADRGLVERLYAEYSGFLARGVEGSFTQFLYARGRIDKELFDRLEVLLPAPRSAAHHATPQVGVRPQAASPPPSAAPALPAAGLAWGSGVRKLPDPTSEASSASERLRLPPDLSRVFRETQELPPEELNQATLRFSAVIPPGTAESSEYQPTLDWKLDSTAQDLEESQDELRLSGSDAEWEPRRLPPRAPRVGERLGPYELTERIGRGGMGLIYRGRSPKGEDVALKVLLPREGAAADKARARFEREVQVLSRLEHRHLVRVRDSGTSGPFQWFAMDYVEGRSLAEIVVEGGLTFEGRLRLFGEVCAALAHAHAQGVIHRDLKPSNILVDGEGRAVVLDLGLAKLTGKEELTVTRTGATLGTPFYMAPEQLMDPRSADARADVFALGAILYELATGQRPFRGETFVEVSKQILHAEPTPPSRLVEGLPAALDEVCARALAKRPEARTPSVEALKAEVDELRRIGESSVDLSGEGSSGDARAQATPPTPEKSPGRTASPAESLPVSRPPSAGRAFVAGVLFGLFLGFGAGFLAGSLWSSRERDGDGPRPAGPPT
ncbi:MAG: serine/threonine protein kinase, partial [Planctomycetota bacterium]